MRTTILIAAPLALLLAGCVSDSGTTDAQSGLKTTGYGSGARTRPPGGPNAAAEDLCVKAVQQQTNAEDVAVIGSDVQGAATQVMIGFPAARQPWRCVYSDGRVTEVTNTGSTGSL